MLLLLALALFAVLTFVWPALRLKRRTGQWGLVSHRGADPCQRLVGTLMGLWMLAVTAWSTAFALLGRAPLGIWAAPSWLSRLGLGLLAAGLLLVVAAQAQMGASWRIGIDDRPTPLVTGGIFRFSRNPIFAGMLLALLGVVAITPSAASLVGWLAMAQLIFVQVRLEEQHLLRLHGDSYDQYLRRVRRFF